MPENNFEIFLSAMVRLHMTILSVNGEVQVLK